MRMKPLALLCLLTLAACSWFASPTPVPVTPTIPPTSTPDSGSCYFTWAYQPLPELSAEFQSALQKVIPNAEGRLNAYGENCTYQDATVTFSAMETDFYITLPVSDPNDDKAIGLLVEQALGVVDQFARPRVPGPVDGLVTFMVKSGGEERTFRITVETGKRLRDQGLHGAELLQAILASP